MAVTGMAPPTLSWEALNAWQALAGVSLAEWECSTLMQLSMVRAEVLAYRPS